MLRSSAWSMTAAVVGPALLLIRIVTGPPPAQGVGISTARRRTAADLFELFKHTNRSLVTPRTFAIAVSTRSAQLALPPEAVPSFTNLFKQLDIRLSLQALVERVEELAARLHRNTTKRVVPVELGLQILSLFYQTANVADARSARLVSREWERYARRRFWESQWFRIGPDLADWDQLAEEVARLGRVHARNVRVDVQTTQLVAGRDDDVPADLRVRLAANTQIRELDLGRYTSLGGGIVRELLAACQGRLEHLSFRVQDMLLWWRCAPGLSAATRLPSLRTLTIRLDSMRPRDGEHLRDTTHPRLASLVRRLLNRRGRLDVIFRYGDELRPEQVSYVNHFFRLWWTQEMEQARWFLEGRRLEQPRHPAVERMLQRWRLELLPSEGTASVAAPERPREAATWRYRVAKVGLQLLVRMAPHMLPLMTLIGAISS